MSEENVTKRITKQTIRTELEKELEVLERAKRVYNKLWDIRSETYNTCDEIQEMTDAYKDYLVRNKGKEEFINKRREIHSLCTEVQKKYREIQDLIFDLFYES